MSDEPDAGVVALETALVLPVVAMLLAALVGVLGLVTEQLQLDRTARAAARVVAVTGDRQAGLTVARSVGADVEVDLTVTGGVARVTLRSEAQVLGVSADITAEATAALEPGAGS